MVFALILTLWYSPTWGEKEIPPSWVFAVDAFLVFLYQTLDNTDGKQARRTGSSSPIGDLVDHGVDSLCLTIGAMLFIITMRFGRGIWAFVAITHAWIPFFLATWEQYFVGGLHLPPINGAMEGILSISILLAGAAIFGDKSQSPLKPVLMVVGIIAMWVASIMNVIKVTNTIVEKKKNFPVGGVAHPAQAVRSRGSAYSYLWPLIHLILLKYAVLFLGWDDIVYGPPYVAILFVIMLTVAFGYICSKFTLAHLVGSPYRHLFKTNFPLLFVAINAIPQVQLMPTRTAILIATIITLSAYCWFVHQVLSQIAHFLDIYIFSLVHLKRMKPVRSFART